VQERFCVNKDSTALGVPSQQAPWYKRSQPNGLCPDTQTILRYLPVHNHFHTRSDTLRATHRVHVLLVAIGANRDRVVALRPCKGSTARHFTYRASDLKRRKCPTPRTPTVFMAARATQSRLHTTAAWSSIEVLVLFSLHITRHGICRGVRSASRIRYSRRIEVRRDLAELLSTLRLDLYLMKTSVFTAL